MLRGDSRAAQSALDGGRAQFPVSRFAFPDRSNVPSMFGKHGLVADVARDIACKLRVPVGGVGLGLRSQTTTCVLVPEAPMHKDRQPPFWKNEVRLSR